MAASEEDKVRFPSGMGQATNVKGGDKIMLADADTGETKVADFDQAKTYLNITGIEVKAVAGGATEATAVVLSPGPDGQVRKMTGVKGWFKNAGGTPWLAPETNDNTNWWDGGTWSLASSTPKPTTPVADDVVEGGTEATSQDAVFKHVENTLFDEVPVGSLILQTADTIRLGKQYNTANPPVLVDSTTADNYIYEIKDIMEIHTTVDDTTGKRQLVYLDASMNTFSGGTVNNFFTSSNVKALLKKDVPSSAKYISFANLKTNSDIRVLYQETIYSSTLKYGMVPTVYTPKLLKKFSVTNQIPYNSGSFNKGKYRDSSGALGSDASYNNYRVSLITPQNVNVELKLNSAYPFVNLYDASGVFLSSKAIGTGVNNISKDLYPEATFIDFSLSTASGSASYFKVFYDKAVDDRRPIYNLLDYLTTAELQKSITASFQALVDTVAAALGGTIYVPAGIYYLRNPVTWKSNINLIGDGANLTIFKPTGALSAFIGENISNFTYKDFCIDGELQQLPVSGVYDSAIKGITQKFLIDVVYRDLIIKNTGASGLGCDFFQRGLIHNVKAYNCGRLADLTKPAAPGASGIGIGTGAFVRGMESLTISDCHAENCGQNGIFVERQYSFYPTDQPIGTTISNCHTERNRIGVGISGNEGLTVVGCSGYENHHANCAYDIGTMSLQGSRGKRVKIIGFVSKRAGMAIPEGYPEYGGDKNGYGLFIKQDYDGIELTNCNFTDSLRSGICVKAGMTAIFINGGTISGNGECGIELNGIINKAKISPSLVDKNSLDGLRINGDLRNVIIKDGIYTENTGFGVNRISGVSTNTIVKDNLAYSNVAGDLNGITQN